jgi:hypothetical protein
MVNVYAVKEQRYLPTEINFVAHSERHCQETCLPEYRDCVTGIQPNMNSVSSECVRHFARGNDRTASKTAAGVFSLM